CFDHPLRVFLCYCVHYAYVCGCSADLVECDDKIQNRSRDAACLCRRSADLRPSSNREALDSVCVCNRCEFCSFVTLAPSCCPYCVFLRLVSQSSVALQWTGHAQYDPQH